MLRPHGIALALCALIAACGGGGDATAPEPPTDDIPGSPQPTTSIIAGTYALRTVNEAVSGQAVTLVNPDDEAIGTYRFDGRSTLRLTEEQTWSLALYFEDEANDHQIQDGGRFRRHGEDWEVLVLESEPYGDTVHGEARDGMAFILYDVDGDGRPETAFGFQRTGS